MDNENENNVNKENNENNEKLNQNVENNSNENNLDNNVANEQVNENMEEKVENPNTEKEEKDKTTSEHKVEEKVENNKKVNTEIKKEVKQETVTEKKKSNTGLIITVVLLSILLVVLICVMLFMFGKKKIGEFVGEGINEVSTIIEEGTNTLEDAGGIFNEIENTGMNDIFGSIMNNTVDDTSVSSSNARTSTLENPLQVGEWGIASKYNTNTSSDQNVNVKVTNIIRGDEAKKMAQDYMNSDISIYKYEEPEAYQEWVVIEYDVDFADTYVPGELGASPNVDADITGPDGSAIKYNGVTYINQVIEIGSRDYIKTKTGSGKLLTQIPVGCTDYIIEFGRYGGTKAYFQGK